MRGKGNQNQEEEEYEEDEFGSRKDGPSSNFTIDNTNSCKGVFFFTLDCTILDPALFFIPFLQGCHSLCSFTPFFVVWFCIFLKKFLKFGMVHFLLLVCFSYHKFGVLGCWNGVFLNGLLSFIYFCIFMIWDLDSEADGKHSDKANAIRSKHSVTEQKRRSKINERFVGLFLWIDY